MLEEILSLLSPGAVRRLDREIRGQLARTPTRINAHGYDPWGFNADAARRELLLVGLAYRYYYRVENFGIENLPAGRCLVISNHAGQLPFDGALLCAAAILEGKPPRVLRGMGDFFLPTVPFLGVIMHRIGSVVGVPKNCIDLLEADEAALVFPEGVRGITKTFNQRYRLKEFGLGFMRLALATRSPIIPVSVVGSEEQYLSVANLGWLARRLGLPGLPVSLPPLGMPPLPVKIRIHWGKPMTFEGDPDEADDAIAPKVEEVRRAVQKGLDEGLRQRSSWFS